MHRSNGLNDDATLKLRSEDEDECDEYNKDDKNDEYECDECDEYEYDNEDSHQQPRAPRTSFEQRNANGEVQMARKRLTSQCSINRLSKEIDAITKTVMDNYYNAKTKVDCESDDSSND